MNLTMAIWALIVLLFSITSSLAQTSTKDSLEANSGIVYGKDHMFVLRAPAGWVLDNSSGVSQNLNAVFYPEGGSWQHSPTVMYANTASKEVKDNQTLQQVIDFDIERFRENHQEVAILPSDSVQTENGKRSVVMLFFYSNYEAVAYIDEETIVAMLVLSAESKSDFDSAFPAFRQLIGSYLFITTDVHVE